MVTRQTVRFNVHLIPGTTRVQWSLSAMVHDSQGIPSLRLLRHGSTDVGDLDPVGIDAALLVLLQAVDRAA